MNNPVSYTLVANPQENPFIVKSYLDSHYHDFPFNQVPISLYKPETIQFLIKLLSQSLVMLVHLENDPDTYLSFLIYQYENNNLVLHYAYTKGDASDGFRRKGLIKDTINLLLPTPETKIIITHPPKSSKILKNFQRLFPHSVFDPFYFMRSYYEHN